METMTEAATTLLIADDHAVVREGIRSLLRLAPGFVVVAEADDGENAVALAGTHVPDVVLLDLMMPGMKGDACKVSLTTTKVDSTGKTNLKRLLRTISGTPTAKKSAKP